MPQFPPLARAAQILGGVDVQVEFVPGTLPKPSIKPGAHGLLSQAVEAVLSQAKFSATCPMRQITLSFLFEIDQVAPPAHTPLSTSIVSSSGLVRVRARRALAGVSYSSGVYEDDQRAMRFLAEACPELGRVIAGGNPAGTYHCEVLNTYERHLLFQVRNMKPKGASGFLGNFQLDYSDLQVTPDEPAYVDSPELRKLRRSIK